MQGSVTVKNLVIPENYETNNGIALHSTTSNVSLTDSGEWNRDGVGLTILWSYNYSDANNNDGFTGTRWTYNPGPFANLLELSVQDQILNYGLNVAQNVETWLQNNSGTENISKFTGQLGSCITYIY